MRIAIIGAGISGLTSAYLLQNKHEVHIFEKESWLGAHTHTLNIQEENNEFAIDTGFIVFNDKTYPNFNKMLNKLNVAKQKTTMSFSVRNIFNGLEYNGTNISGLFAQRQNMLNVKYLKMLYSIVAFNKIAKNIVIDDKQLTLNEFIKKYNFNQYMIDNYLLPICSAIWSCEQERMLATPVKFLFDFLNNHGMLNINDRPEWFVVKNGSHQYVNILLKSKRLNYYKNNPVLSVSRQGDNVVVKTKNNTQQFDVAIMATHANDTLAILDNPSPEEVNILSCFPYQNNEVILHTDIRLLPKCRRAWAAWNYLVDNNSKQSCRLSYNMNILQNLKARKTYCVSINQSDLINEKTIIAKFNYHHPIYTQAGFDAQKAHLKISGKNKIYYSGAYWGYGFHEDGVNSTLHIIDHIGGSEL